MKKNDARRNFIKNATVGLSGLTLSAFTGSSLTAAAGIQEKDDRKMKIVCLGAHPGDPEFGCGGTMAKFAATGHSVTFLYLTRGEAGDPTKSFAESAALRTAEAETACRLLHAKAVFAGQVDGNTILSREKTSEMIVLIKSENPDLLFTQWPVDSHPDHQVTGMMAISAWTRSERKFPLYFYEVNTGSETMHFTPTDYVDITEVRELKKEAMFAHKTQDPINTYNDFFKPLEEFRGLEAGVKAAEAFILFKDKKNRTTIPGI